MLLLKPTLIQPFLQGGTKDLAMHIQIEKIVETQNLKPVEQKKRNITNEIQIRKTKNLQITPH